MWSARFHLPGEHVCARCETALVPASGGRALTASPVERHAVRVMGAPGGRTVVLGNGLGCDQRLWRDVAAALSGRFRVVTFDHVGHGMADASAFDPVRHGELDGYADDLLAVCDELGLDRILYVGHSVSAAVGALAAARCPGRFAALVLLAASPRYLDDDGYVGGFTREAVDGVLEAIDADWGDWVEATAPTIAGGEDRPEAAARVVRAFMGTRPQVARRFARATFLSDIRDALPAVDAPALVLQCAEDPMVPPEVGGYLRLALPESELVVLQASGHVPHVTVPGQTSASIEAYLGRI